MTSLSAKAERHLLQIVIAAGGFVPVCSGLVGGVLGAAMFGETAVSASLDNHVRGLSGLMLGIGLAFWQAVPQIERHTARIRLLTALVVLGGLLRLIGIFAVDVPKLPSLLGVTMELVVAPLVCLWQGRVAQRFEHLS